MNSQEAKAFVERERNRWLLGTRGISDAEFMRRRERLLNGLSMTFALLALVSAFWAGVVGWGVYGWYFSIAGCVIAARQCSLHANRCREARRVLAEGTAP
jgi:hypothetical protein